MRDNPPHYIRLVADLDRKRARSLYAEHYGRATDDRAIDEDLHDVLRHHDFDEAGEHIAVPAELVLGFVLRPRGKGRGRKHSRPPLERWPQRFRVLAVKLASKRWRELVATGVHSKPARHTAAVEVQKDFAKTARISVRWLEENMRLKPNRESR
jgi:hypothetical protein